MNRTLLAPLIISILSWVVLETHGSAMDDGPARKLINSQGCKACHALENHGGTAAPSFEQMRNRLSREKIRQQLVNQEHRHGNGRIPDFSNLTENEIEALIVFIRPEP
jgi:mono/diheme cytochrome c family protein